MNGGALVGWVCVALFALLCLRNYLHHRAAQDLIYGWPKEDDSEHANEAWLTQLRQLRDADAAQIRR